MNSAVPGSRAGPGERENDVRLAVERNCRYSPGGGEAGRALDGRERIQRAVGGAMGRDLELLSFGGALSGRGCWAPGACREGEVFGTLRDEVRATDAGSNISRVSFSCSGRPLTQ